MKLLPVLICIILYANSVSANGIRVKRGLNADEQKKLVDELNKDRKEAGIKLGIPMGRITYDTSFEKKIESINCDETNGDHGAIVLQHNSVVQEFQDYLDDHVGTETIHKLFHPAVTKIGCSKTITCSTVLTKEMMAKLGSGADKFVGKTAAFQGMCYVNWKRDSESMVASSLKDLPNPSKYGNLLGVLKTNGARLASLNSLISVLLVLFI